MKILISNDDGYLAPGIVALANILRPIADITVVAPDSNRSGTSNALTLDRPLSVWQADNGFHVVNGTPSDCVHVALTAIMKEPPDLIVSGINQGQNMGEDTLYSGTVAAAMEGYLFNIPSIAFSQVERAWLHLDAAAEMALKIVMLPKLHLPKPYLLNVNIPSIPLQDIKGIKSARLGKRHMSESVIRAFNPQGKEIYWIGPAGAAKDTSAGTDFDVTSKNYVSITPLQIDLSNYSQMNHLNLDLE